MLSTRETKLKIRSINNTKQITKAMEMVSASKMRKSQLVALNSRPYCQIALEMLGKLSEHTDYNLHPLLKKKPVQEKIALLIITSDKGLCGGLNANVLKQAQKFLAGRKADIIAVGKKGRDFFARRKFNIAAEFTGIGDSVNIKQTSPIAELLIKYYEEGKYDLIVAVYANFLSTLKQEAVIRQVLPISIEGIKEILTGIVPERGRYAELAQDKKNKEANLYKYRYEYLYEPSPESVLNVLLPNLLHVQVYHMVLEANASEHSARMVAMKNATESAQKLIEELTLSFNKVRQSAITKEISEITAGAEALQQ
ncbi:MAG: ATP synthase F1 subunit gamma [Candidatus Nealsonbacteria bacterium]|nr:ATP synthase F1 subunit gamma [Candidatus Nealsonbacteria bacterium]